MTAIALLIRELNDLLDAFWHNRFNLEQSFQYYHRKRRLQLFYFHCRKHWLQQCNEYSTECSQKHSMQHAAGGNIDFAAIEATTNYMPIEELGRQHVRCLGDVDLNVEEFRNFKVNMLLLSAFNIIQEEERRIEQLRRTDSFYEYSDALPKLQTDEIGQLTEGVSFTISGKIAINCERFSINFMYKNETRDIALHINPRIPQNYIVRNTKVYDVWGREEVSSALPFLLRRGDKFTIQVLITDACYMISVNGHHFAEYSHRLPYKDVQILEVKGDVEEVQMQRTTVQSYPQRLPESTVRIIEENLADESDEVDANIKENISIPQEWCLINRSLKVSGNSPQSKNNGIDQGLLLPYYGTLKPKSLKEGRCLRIEGRVRILPLSFYINLQQGQNIWPHPVIAFHLNPRFSQTSTGAIGKAVVCRNAWYNGQWGEEERSELDTNFRPGRTFSLAIVCSKDSFQVYVNRQFITEFKYRVPPDIVDTVYIQGDVKLWNVTLEHNPRIRGKNVRIYHNPLDIDEY